MRNLASNWSGYAAAPLEALHGSAPDYELFIQRPGASELVLYRSRHVNVSADDLEQLKARGIDRVYIPERDLPAFRTQLTQRVLDSRSNASPIQRAAAAVFLARSTLAEVYASRKSERLIHSAGSLADMLTQQLADDSVRMPALMQLVEHDFYTYTHVCNVSLYCVLIARRLGISDIAELREISIGGLLHDIGKNRVPPRLLNKRGKLTPEEWEVVCRHPADGYRELVGRGDISWGILMMTYQHHERFDGSGYPAAILAEDIHPWARICAVADVFDALTSDRPYRRALSIDNVTSMLRRQAGMWFDTEIVECLAQEMEESACHAD